MIIRMFIEFFKVGFFSIGGGLATLPFLYELSNKTHWFSHNDIADMLAVSESTPGALGINMSTFAGYKTAGIAGAIISTLGLIAPSILIIIVIAHFLNKFKTSKLVQKALYGLRPASVALICIAGFNVASTCLINTNASKITQFFHLKAILLAIVLFFIQKRIKLHPIFYIVGCAMIGVLFQM